MILYINGCSWSCKSSEMMTTKVYGDFLAEKLNAELINHSVPASCNDRIFRSTFRNIADLKDQEEVVCILNISQIYRSEIWLDSTQQQILAEVTPTGLRTAATNKILNTYQKTNDGDYASFIFNHPGIVSYHPLYKQLEKNAIVFNHYEREYYELFYKLTMLTSYFKQHNIKYLIFAGTNLLDYDLLEDLPWISAVKKGAISDPAILNFEKENFCQWAYYNGYRNYELVVDPVNPWTGHPDEHAHAAWADFLYNKLKDLYEI